ncbi:MAG TPA: GNAT family N-acetyltransferase [Mycobacteriales bacterium]|nr:GNAT family N-acetyltransferase [Mycobacteriales bacterium]
MGDGARIATAADAAVVAELLDAFNREFDTPTPGPAVLQRRLCHLLSGQEVYAVVAGEPVTGVALVTLRPNVWFDGPVALLDELYVVPPLRDQGIGTDLLHTAERVARERGCELFEVNVDGEDTDTRRFYERHGYRCVEAGQSEPSLYYFRAV